MFFLAVNIIKKNCVIGKQGFSLFPFFVLGIVPIFANDNYTLTDLHHTVAHTDMGLDILGAVCAGVDLLSESGHEYPEGHDIAGSAAAPDLLHNIRVGQDFSHIPGQKA